MRKKTPPERLNEAGPYDLAVERDRVRRERVESWHDSIERVVTAAIDYEKEKGRDDNLHPARESKRWNNLWDAITTAYLAREEISKPIAVQEIELDIVLRRRGEEMANRSRNRRKSRKVDE